MIMITSERGKGAEQAGGGEEYGRQEEQSRTDIKRGRKEYRTNINQVSAYTGLRIGLEYVFRYSLHF